MFVDAIEMAAQYTRPIHTIDRYFGTTDVIPGAATLFFVNADGWALTCKHVAQMFPMADQLGKRYLAFTKERSSLSRERRRQGERELERKYDLAKGKLYEHKNCFVNCVEGELDVEIFMHPAHDVALMQFKNFKTLGPTEFPTFAASEAGLKQGQSICRLGFPFPEFTNYKYDAEADTIRWTDEGRRETPRFPIEGMVTRHLMGQEGIVGFEVSTPGLRGQSGGPAFDPTGRVWGMQSATRHLDLNFDVDLEVFRDGRKKHVQDSAVLHVGHCVHVSVLKSFMRERGVTFSEG